MEPLQQIPRLRFASEYRLQAAERVVPLHPAPV
jgi:hypothetical protein